MLEPDKIALATLYQLYASNDSKAECDPAGIAARLQGVASPDVISVQLERLDELKLAVPAGGILAVFGDVSLPRKDWWDISDKGRDLARTLVAQRKSFMGKLHINGSVWLKSQEARKAPVGLKLTTPHIDQILKSPSPAVPIDWTKWGTIIGGVGIIVAIIIAVVQ